MIRMSAIQTEPIYKLQKGNCQIGPMDIFNREIKTLQTRTTPAAHCCDNCARHCARSARQRAKKDYCADE